MTPPKASRIAPDGSFDWPATGMVRALREAMESLGSKGWTRLEDARTWLAAHHSEQTPRSTVAGHGRRWSVSQGCSTFSTARQWTVARRPGFASGNGPKFRNVRYLIRLGLPC
jgi:hypothetical protein